MSTTTIDEIYFSFDTIKFYMKLSQKDQNKFIFFINSKLYFIELIVFYYPAVLIVRTGCKFGKFSDTMFSKIFYRKAIKLRRSASVKNVSLNGKVVVGYSRGHETIILLFKFEENQEKIVRLCGKNMSWWLL